MKDAISIMLRVIAVFDSSVQRRLVRLQSLVT